MHGLELIETLKNLPPHTPAAVFLRHAERYPITDAAAPHLPELTPKGVADAEAFGAKLQGFDCIRLFHSPVVRCRQTAEAIARSAASSGHAVEIAGPEDALGPGYILDSAEAGRLTIQHREHFVRLWLTGEIAPAVIRRAVELASLKINYVMERLQQPCPRGRRLDLHVSHDWNILALRELLCAVRHEDVGWLDFLDGIAFSPRDDGRVQVIYRDRAITHALPWNSQSPLS